MTKISRRNFLGGLGATALRALLGRKHGAAILPGPEREYLVQLGKENRLIQPQWRGVSVGKWRQRGRLGRTLLQRFKAWASMAGMSTEKTMEMRLAIAREYGIIQPQWQRVPIGRESKLICGNFAILPEWPEPPPWIHVKFTQGETVFRYVSRTETNDEIGLGTLEYIGHVEKGQFFSNA